MNTAKTIEEVIEWIRVRFNIRPEDVSSGSAYYTDREHAGDEEPSPSVIARVKNQVKEIRGQFSNVRVDIEFVDEWVDMEIRLTK